MNAKELIESGKLELYVAGVVCGRERDHIAAMVNADPELQREVQAIEAVMLASLNEGKREPRNAVKQNILAAIKKGSSETVVRKLDPVPAAHDVKEGRAVPMGSINRWLAAASIALLVGLSATFYVLNQKLELQREQIASMSERYRLQVALDDSSKAVYEKFSSQLALINHHATKKILLNGVAATPDAKSVVYWNTLNGRVIINPAELPAPPSDKQYQLWALLDGKPIDAGVFTINHDSIQLQEVKNITNAQAFAITLEQKGGVASPTLSAMYVMGAI